ncbi:hypothetical protein L1S32_03035 [Methanogenium sp. S4BF]|uniref:hypothetical protein n=1 Tax=Methanogenium sp. S4BF TaxID=1789226 RepID=UPI0024169931|nr:hypothetical protein [Methanogenium sp. S4BF]WFN35109.1 hypothetical protein L1S32_03035 [Methanogenium sp. S4BF]
MKKIIVALLVAALCLVAPAVALDWEMLPFSTQVMIDGTYPPGAVCGSYFDVYIGGDSVGLIAEESNGMVYPGWCVDTMTDSIKDYWYCAELSSTIGVSEKWNKINWVINNKGDATSGEVQAAIWMILGQKVPARYADWETAVALQLVNDADPSFIPECDMIGAVLVVPCQMTGQAAVIEVPMPPCPPPVPEFPTMMIPVFLVGSVMVAASVLKKE